MALPEDPSEATTLPCKNKYVTNVIIQKLKALMASMSAISFPIAIGSGGTGTTTTALARVAFKLPSIDLAAGTIINWALSTNFYNTIDTSKAFTMSNIADGLSVQLLITNSDDADITPTFPAGIEWAGGVDPGAIPAGAKALYSFTSINSVYIGVFTPLFEPAV